MKLALILPLCLLVTGAGLRAQSVDSHPLKSGDPAEWSALRTSTEAPPPIRKNYFTVLKTTSGKKWQGYFYDISDDRVSLSRRIPRSYQGDSLKQVTDFQYQGIETIRFRKKGSIGTGIMIGILGGTLVGALIGSASSKTTYHYTSFFTYDYASEQKNTGEGAFLGAITGGLAGAIIGALVHKTFIIKGHREKYAAMQEKMMQKAF